MYQSTFCCLQKAINTRPSGKNDTSEWAPAEPMSFLPLNARTLSKGDLGEQENLAEFIYNLRRAIEMGVVNYVICTGRH